MDEFAPFHALGCVAHPLSREHHVFREGCGEYGLRPPLLPVTMPLRSYLYIGSLPVLPFYPFWRILDDPVAVRVQGALFFLAALTLAARLLGLDWTRAALAAFVFPLFPGSFLIDTGPVGLSLVLLLSALLLLRRAATSPERSLPAAAAAGFLCFLGVWIKPVFAWSIPAVALFAVVRAVRPTAPPRRPFRAALAFVLTLLVPSAALLASRTIDGTPYYEVLSVGRFSLEPQSLGTVAASLFAYLWNGSSLAPRSVFFPASPIDRLPLALAAGILLAGLAGARRRDVALWLAAGLATFGATVLSGRALASHHLAFSLLFLYLALATASVALPGRTLGAAGALVVLFWGSLAVRAPAASVDPRSNAAKDRLLAWIRETGLDRRTVQLHASWGTYYIAHLFGAPDEIVLFSRKFAREPEYLEAARGLAESEGRGILLLTCEPERFRADVVEAVLGAPAAQHVFGNWKAIAYRRPGDGGRSASVQTGQQAGPALRVAPPGLAVQPRQVRFLEPDPTQDDDKPHEQ